MTRREWWLALVAFLVLFAWPLREGLLRSDRVLFAVDTATVQLPWSVRDEPRNPELSDQGVVFYPAYRFVIEHWVEHGAPPLWNPYVHLGAPALGNPQLGVLDPQVLALAGLERVGGRAWSDRGLAFLAWGRLVAAALGAYMLARHLRLGAAGAALCGIGFGGSGFLVLWLNASLGHVAPFLPWILLALEQTRGTRPWRAVGAAAVLFGCAILGGHPETAFFVGACAGLWSLSILQQSRRAGLRSLVALGLGTLLAAPSLLPFVEYMLLSGAREARAARTGAWPEPLPVGLLLLAFGVIAGWRAAQVEGARSWLTVLGVGAALGAVVFASAACPPLMLLHDLGGAPGRDGMAWSLAGSFVERVSPWLAAPVLGLAIAGALLPACAFPRRRWVLSMGVVAWLLAHDQSVLLGVFRAVPGVGLAETGRLAVVSALMLSLLAGAALERAPRTARTAAGLVVLVQLVALLVTDLPAAVTPNEVLDPPDEIVAYDARPPERLAPTDALVLVGRVHPGLPAADVRVRAESSEHTLELIVETRREADGTLMFQLAKGDATELERGIWRLRVNVLDDGGALLGTRVAAAFVVSPDLAPRGTSVVLLALALAALLALPPTRRGWRAWLFVVLAALGVLDFAEGKNPAVPTAEVFPETATERILARELGTRRFFADPGVLPPNTGMVRGLRSLNGYDGLDVAAFNDLRYAALLPGVHPILDWNPRGVDLASPAFRLFGVGMLVCAEPLEHPDWELIAAPIRHTEDAFGTPLEHELEYAETWLYRARDPLPSAWCVAQLVPFAQAATGAVVFDPLTEAFLDAGIPWALPEPMTRSSVQVLEWFPDRIALNAELDGDGLLVVPEQNFPGWQVTVDGAPGKLLGTNAGLRGVPLDAGQHLVRLEFRPGSLVPGSILFLCAAVASLALLLLGGRQRTEPATNHHP